MLTFQAILEELGQYYLDQCIQDHNHINPNLNLNLNSFQPNRLPNQPPLDHRIHYLPISTFQVG